MDRQEIRRRLNSENGRVPIIDKIMLRGGMTERNLRKEIKRYGNEVKKFNEMDLIPVIPDNSFKFITRVEVARVVEEVKRPKMKRLRNQNLGWFM